MQILPSGSQNRPLCRRFLNRLLGVEVARQNLLFNYFMATLTAEIRAAKEEGRYSEGVSDLPVTNIYEPPEPQVDLIAQRDSCVLLEWPKASLPSVLLKTNMLQFLLYLQASLRFSMMRSEGMVAILKMQQRQERPA